MGYGKTRFFGKNKKRILGYVLGITVWASNPVFYSVLEGFFVSRKASFLDPLDPPDTKTELWCESGDDFRGFVFEPEKCPRRPKRWVKMAPVSPV